VSDRSNIQDHDALERALGRLGEDVVFPETPDFITPLWRDTPATPSPRRVMAGSWPLAALAALAAVVIAALVVSIPGTRSTVAGWLEIAGIRIETGDDPQTAVPVSLGGNLFLGRPVSLAEAQSTVSFDVLAPASPAVGEAEIYLDHRDGAPVVSLVYPASEMLPPIGETGAGLLLTQFEAGDEAGMYIKRVAGSLALEVVTVNGALAAWVVDGTLALPGGTARADLERPSAHVLIWEANGITVRMETMLTLDEALLVAEDIAPAAAPATAPDRATP